jgi:hypothetical protein
VRFQVLQAPVQETAGAFFYVDFFAAMVSSGARDLQELKAKWFKPRSFKPKSDLD